MIIATGFDKYDAFRALEMMGRNPNLVDSIFWDTRSQKYGVQYSTSDKSTRLEHKTAFIDTETLTRAKIVKTIDFAKGVYITGDGKVGKTQDAYVNLASLSCTCREHTDITDKESGVSFCRHSIAAAKQLLGLTNMSEIIQYVKEQGYANVA